MSRSDMILIGFLQAQNCSNYTGAWRHPAAMQDFLSAKFYQRIAQTLEAAKFHLAFFDDRLAMPDIMGGDHRATVQYGSRPIKLDPIPVMTAMGMATDRLGLGATYSTTYYEPYHVARQFATLDLMLEGRAAWNVVTSLNNSEAENFGRSEHLDHDLRYERADEFMEVVTGHWASWADDALIIDRNTGQFADPDKVRRLDHDGRFFKSRGPLTVPRSPQGHPVIIQAGQSGAGKRFAARWAELVFAGYFNLEDAKKRYREIKDEIANAGRDPDIVKVAPAIYTVVGETSEAAAEKQAIIESLADPREALTLVAEACNFDFSKHPADEPLGDAEMSDIANTLNIVDRVTKAAGSPNPTPNDFAKYSGRESIHTIPVFSGTVADVADQLEEWYVGEGCDGFVLAATHRPGAYEDFARLVVPELQRRGLFRTEYVGKTLRENLGIPRPIIR